MVVYIICKPVKLLYRAYLIYAVFLLWRFDALGAVIFSCTAGMVMPAEACEVPDDLVGGSQRTGIIVASDSLPPDFLCTAIQQFGNLAALELLLGSGVCVCRIALKIAIFDGVSVGYSVGIYSGYRSYEEAVGNLTFF